MRVFTAEPLNPVRDGRVGAMIACLPAAWREPALLAALESCDTNEHEEFVRYLITYLRAPAVPAGSASWIAVARCWRRMGWASRAVLLDHFGDEIRELLPRVIARPEPDVRIGGYLIASDLALGWSGCWNEIGTRLSASLETRRVCETALSEAGAHYVDHREPRVLEAILAIAGDGAGPLYAFLADAAQPGHLALRSAARTRVTRLDDHRLMRWLRVPALAGMARDEIERRIGREGNTGMLELSHLLRHPGRTAELRRSVHAGHALNMSGTEGESTRALIGRLRWLSVTPTRRPALLETLERAADHSEVLVRFEAARALRGMTPAPESDALLQMLALDSDEGVAGVAAQAIAQAGSRSRRRSLRAVFERLSSSPFASIRRIAEEFKGSDAASSEGRVARASPATDASGGVAP